jgi:hypothetical protein
MLDKSRWVLCPATSLPCPVLPPMANVLILSSCHMLFTPMPLHASIVQFIARTIRVSSIKFGRIKEEPHILSLLHVAESVLVFPCPAQIPRCAAEQAELPRTSCLMQCALLCQVVIDSFRQGSIIVDSTTALLDARTYAEADRLVISIR